MDLSSRLAGALEGAAAEGAQELLEAGAGRAAEGSEGPVHQNAPICTTFEGGAQADPALASPEELEAPLSSKQLEALRLILVGRSMSAVAQALGVDRSTLFRWRQQPMFAASLRFRQEAIFNQAADRLRASLVRAMREINTELRSRSPDARLAAAYRLLPYVGSPRLRPRESPPAPETRQRPREPGLEGVDPLEPVAGGVR